jgi:DNA-binding NtrC family response regulator
MAMLVHPASPERGSHVLASESGLRDFSPMAKKSPNVRVLIVDDESLIRWSLAETLTDEGYGVLEAADGQGALEVLRNTPRPVDVIMLDYKLPDSNGLQLLGQIRVLSPGSRVVMMTAHGTPEVIAEAIRLGAVCVVNKPIDMHAVAGLVSRVHASSPA